MALDDETLAQFPVPLRTAIDRSVANLVRVNALVALYQRYKGESAPISNFEPEDILRACVVLLHATLEDALRSIARVLMFKTAGAQDWDLISTGESRQPEKVRLGWLLQFRGKTVDEVLTERAAYHFEQTSFSKIEQVEGQLRAIGIKSTPFGKFFDQLSALIARRHKIVHSGDFESPEIRTPSPLDADTVKRWHDAVKGFIILLLDTAAPKL